MQRYEGKMTTSHATIFEYSLSVFKIELLIVKLKLFESILKVFQIPVSATGSW